MFREPQTNNNSLLYLKPLFIVLKCLGVGPTTLQLHKSVEFVWKVYSLFLTSAILYCYTYNTLLKIIFSSYNRNSFLSFMDLLCDLCLVVSDVMSITYATFRNKKFVTTFMKTIAKDDLCFRGRKVSTVRKRRIFLVEFVTVMVFVVSYNVYNFYVFVFTVPFLPLSFVFFREFSVYLNVIGLLQMYNFVLVIRNKFALLNRSMRKEIFVLKKTMFIESAWSVDVYLEKFVEYCDLVEMFGKIFGQRILWVFSFVVIMTVEGFQVGLNCFAHISLQRLGDENCSYVGIANLLEVSIYVVHLHI